MIDQDKQTCFPDGEPITPFDLHPVVHERPIGVRAIAFLMLCALAFALSWLLFTAMSEREVHADEAVVIYTREAAGAPECTIDAELRVRGVKRAGCVERLETAGRLARAEMKVNEGRKVKR